MSAYKRLCECGNDEDTHWKDPITGKRLACAAAFCGCKEFRLKQDLSRGDPLKGEPLPPMRPRIDTDPDDTEPVDSDWGPTLGAD